MWTTCLDAIAVAGCKSYVFVRLAQKQTDLPRQHVERIIDPVVKVPRYFLSRGDLKLADSEARPLAVVGATFNLIQTARVFYRFFLFHLALHCQTGKSNRKINRNDIYEPRDEIPLPNLRLCSVRDWPRLHGCGPNGRGQARRRADQDHNGLGHARAQVVSRVGEGSCCRSCLQRVRGWLSTARGRALEPRKE